MEVSSWDHVFASGSDDLPSYTVEVGMPKVPAIFLHAGVTLNSIALEFTRSGAAAATSNAVAQGATGGTPVDLEFAYTLSAQTKLVLTAHEVYLPKPKLAVEDRSTRRSAGGAEPTSGSPAR